MLENFKQRHPIRYKYLFTVTTFSKYLALLMFIIFPILGFYLGMKYQEKVAFNTSVTTGVKKTITPTVFPSTTENSNPIYKAEIKINKYVSENSTHLFSKYYEKDSNKIYFTVETESGNNSKLIEYDLSTDVFKYLSPGKIFVTDDLGNRYEDTFNILSAFKGKLFLTVMPRGGSVYYQWFKIFDVASQKFTDVKEPKDFAIFNDTGEKVAYTKKVNIVSKSSYDKELIVENTDETNQRIIYTVKNVKDNYWTIYPNVGNYYFKNNVLYYKVAIDKDNVKEYTYSL